MTILVTGSRGKTALPLTHLLIAAQHSVIVASRSPSRPSTDSSTAHPIPTVRFDWHDQSTWDLPFTHPHAQADPITAAYLVGCDEPETVSDLVIGFMRHARSRGVSRFVLLSAWEVPPGGWLMGRAHETLAQMGREEGVEWAVLRPNFFMENFLTGYHAESIGKGKIYTAAGEGKLAFISAQDIAAVAFRALTDEESHNTARILTGPEALSYGEVAAILSDELQRPIKHENMKPDGFKRLLMDDGMDDVMASYMTELDAKVAVNTGNKVTSSILEVTGRPPRTFREFVRENAQRWSH